MINDRAITTCIIVFTCLCLVNYVDCLSSREARTLNKKIDMMRNGIENKLVSAMVEIDELRDIVRNCSCREPNGTTTAHGGWTDWVPWGKCSVTCGIGLSLRERECSNPSPGPRGYPCIGEYTDAKMCMIKECIQLGAMQTLQWDNWSEWGDCFTDCKGSVRGRQQTRARVSSGPSDKQSQSESRPCNAVQFAGCVTPSNDANDNYGVTYDFADQLAQSTCTAISKGGYVNAVRRTCAKTADTCETVCKSIGRTCINSLHVYRGSPVLNRTDVAKKGLQMYKYNSCGGGCGPNFCCCNS